MKHISLYLRGTRGQNWSNVEDIEANNMTSWCWHLQVSESFTAKPQGGSPTVHVLRDRPGPQKLLHLREQLGFVTVPSLWAISWAKLRAEFWRFTSNLLLLSQNFSKGSCAGTKKKPWSPVSFPSKLPVILLRPLAHARAASAGIGRSCNGHAALLSSCLRWGRWSWRHWNWYWNSCWNLLLVSTCSNRPWQ